MKFLTFIVLYLIIFKFMPKCVKEGDKFLKTVKPYEPKKVIKIPVAPARGLYKKEGLHKDCFDMFDRIKGSPDMYVDSDGKVYAQGVIQGDNPYFITKPSVLYADIEHMGEFEWFDKYGHYDAMVSKNREGKMEPVGNYFLYFPERCPICGKPIVKKEIDYPYGGTIYTASLLDSHERYCRECNDKMLEHLDSYYPFFIDTLNKKLITQKDRRQFEDYMCDVINMSKVRGWIQDAETRGDIDWVDFDETLLTKQNLNEYTKNEDVALMWHRLKVCK